MALDFDKVLVEYDRLVSGASSCWEIYAGERTEAIAEEYGIPADKWTADIAAMQLGQETLEYELSRELPQTPEEREQRLRSVISRQVNSRLRSQNSDAARKGLLLQALQAGGAANESEFAALSQMDLKILQDKVIDRVLTLTTEEVIPAMREQCRLAAQEGEHQTAVLDNSGALAVAGYLEVPETRNMPGVMGVGGSVVSCCYMDTQGVDIIEIVAYALMTAAAVIACVALLQLAASAIAAAAAHVIVEGTLAGIGSAIASEISMVFSFIVVGLKLALNCSRLGKLASALAGIFHHGETTKAGISEEQTLSACDVSVT